MKAGWEATKVGQACTVIAGQSPEGSAYNDGAIGLPFYQGKKEFGERFLRTPTTWTTVTTKEAHAGDILMSVRAPVGPINEATETICIGRGLAAIRAKPGLSRHFLWYALLWLQPSIKGSSGAVFDSINKAGIESLPIPLPAIEEQEQIVAILDEAFEGLARAHAHAEANLQNARELFESFRDELLGNPHSGWIEAPLSKYLERITYGFTNPMPDTNEGPLKITAKNVKEGVIDLVGARSTTQTAFDTLLTDKSRPKIGDVLLTKDGTLGRTAVVDIEGLCVNQSVAVLTPTREILSTFLHEVLSCRVNQTAMIAGAGGATIKHLYITRVPKIMVFVPDISEQERALETLSTFQKEARQLISNYNDKLVYLDSLRQSLLQKAFAGELT